MAGKEPTLWELKQAAKWSRALEDRRRAVEEMARAYREGAINALIEVKNTAVHDEIKRACINAIRSVGLKGITDIQPVTEEKAKAPQDEKKGSRAGNGKTSSKRKHP